MVFGKPIQDITFQFSNERQKLFGFRFCNGTDVFVFHCVPFGTAPIKVQCVIFFLCAQDQGQCLEGAVVLEVPLSAIAGGIKKNGAKLQSRVIADSELPIG